MANKINSIQLNNSYLFCRDNIDKSKNVGTYYNKAKKEGYRIKIMNSQNYNCLVMVSKVLKMENPSIDDLMGMGMPYRKAYYYCKKYGINRFKKNRKVHSNRKIDKEKIIRLYENKMSMADIGKKLGCSRQYVQLVIKEYKDENK